MLISRRAAIINVHRVVVIALIMIRRLLCRIQHVRLRLVQHVRLLRDTQLSALRLRHITALYN